MTFRERFRDTYNHVAPYLTGIIVLIVGVLSVSAYNELRTNHVQDEQRIADQSRVQACLDSFSANLVGSLPPVRDATAARDVALGDVMRQLQNTLQKVVVHAAGDRDVEALVGSLQTYTATEKRLEKAREDNPYPAPPTKFCDLSHDNNTLPQSPIPSPSVKVEKPGKPVPSVASHSTAGARPHGPVVGRHHATRHRAHHAPKPGAHHPSPHPSPSPSPTPPKCVALPMFPTVCVPLNLP